MDEDEYLSEAWLFNVRHHSGGFEEEDIYRTSYKPLHEPLKTKKNPQTYQNLLLLMLSDPKQ